MSDQYQSLSHQHTQISFQRILHVWWGQKLSILWLSKYMKSKGHVEEYARWLACTSNVALKPICKKSWSSLLNMRRKLCLKIDIANESDRTMTLFVGLGNDFISSKPTWSKQPANKSTAWPLLDTLFANRTKTKQTMMPWYTVSLIQDKPLLHVCSAWHCPVRCHDESK